MASNKPRSSSAAKPVRKKGEENLTYNSILHRNQDSAHVGVYIATPCTGLVRMEWCLGRFGQITPTNWSAKQSFHNIPMCAPMGYLVADAENIAVRYFLESNCSFFLSIEHDNVLPPDAFVRFNDYIIKKQIPIVSAVYFTKSYPAEPLVYRGRGNGYFDQWKFGDKVWVDACPQGCIIIHRSILELLWKESEEYAPGNPPVPTRRVFTQPERVWLDPERGWETATGTSDMELCSRIIVDNVLARAGWPKIARKKYPFLIDTGIHARHIDPNGQMYPNDIEIELWKLEPNKRPVLTGKVI